VRPAVKWRKGKKERTLEEERSKGGRGRKELRKDKG